MKKNFVIVHDQRLNGVVTSKRPQVSVIDLDANTSLDVAFGKINAIDDIHSIFILCHGYAGVNIKEKICVDAGGMGLQLGKECVLHGNVGMWKKIADKAENIVVYACAAGDTESGNEGTTADGKYLMGALAIYTDSIVYAADRIQYYQPNQNGHIDFGDWEGQLWMFPPSGFKALPALRAPVELDDVMS